MDGIGLEDIRGECNLQWLNSRLRADLIELASPAPSPSVTLLAITLAAAFDPHSNTIYSPLSPHGSWRWREKHLICVSCGMSG
jgi:hypothetical protein